MLIIVLCQHIFDLRIRSAFEQVDGNTLVGFMPVDCWFTPEADWPVTECYYMHVPENHEKSQRRIISFPVVVFRSNAIFSYKSPVLHLGAGGPGAPMNFQSTESVRAILEYHDEMSLNQGRDLFVIDPRGAGLSYPLLMCETFIDNELKRLQRNLTLEQELKEIDQDYYHCIDKFKIQGVDFSAYNSISVVHDIELMRKSAKVEQWVLLGVSYGTIYAQFVAFEYPDSVESMILDSATFPNLKAQHNFVTRTLAPYHALYDYCDANPECDEPIQNIKQRIWKLYQALNANSMQVEISHPYDMHTITIALNGERFLAAIMTGMYGKEIFKDIPQIIIDLEIGQFDSIKPYLEAHVAYLLDSNYGDVSADTHYCYEDKSFTDFALMKTLANELPEGYIRDTTLLALDWPDYCDKMQIRPGDPKIAKARSTEVPTLFLHGVLDTITPLSDVVEQKPHFTRSQLVTYNVSHSVLSTDECAEFVAGKFIDNTTIDREQLTCY